MDTPVWGERHCADIEWNESGYTDPGTITYRTCCTANAWHGAALSARILEDTDLAKSLWNHEAFFDYTDIYMDEGHTGYTRSWAAFNGDMWDTYRPTLDDSGSPPPDNTDTTPTATRTGLFLSSDEIAAVKAKVLANEQPWKDGYAAIVSAANSAMSVSPRGVTENGGGHLFRSTVDVGDDYPNAQLVGYAVRDLGLGYAFTGNTAYAEKVIDLIYAWCLNPSICMEPTYIPYQPGVCMGITLPAMFYGADLFNQNIGLLVHTHGKTHL